VLQRVALTVAAGALVVTAEVAATLSAASVHQPTARRPAAGAAPRPPSPQHGEPELPASSSAPSSARSAATRFVRDFARWSSGRARTIPSRDMTGQVLRLLEAEDRAGAVDVVHAVASVRIAPAQGGTYVVTSAIGNFLVGRQQSRWLVISLPGD
jgi:hypothetical protein